MNINSILLDKRFGPNFLKYYPFIIAVINASKTSAWKQSSFSNEGTPAVGNWSDCPAFDTSTMGPVHAHGLK